MKTITFCATIMLSLLFASCAGEAGQNAKSVNVDSTNVTGTAPVRYGPNDPKDTSPRLPPQDDTGRRSNTSGKEEKEVR